MKMDETDSVVQAHIDELVKRGDMCVSGVDADTGETLYKLTKKGKRRAEKMIMEGGLGGNTPAIPYNDSGRS